MHQYGGNVHDGTWWAARICEGLSVGCLLILAVWVGRRCLRERRLLFDAQLMIAGAAVYWLDPVPNFFQPLWFYSSKFVTLANWTGHLPGVVNPDAGRFPEALLFTGPIYPGAVVAFVLLINAVMRGIKRRWPNASTLEVLAGAFATGLAIDIVLEWSLYRVHLTSNPGIRKFLTLFPGAQWR